MKFLILFFSGLFAVAIASAQTNCQLKKDDEGIKVFLCDSEISDFKTIVVDFVAPATLSQYAALILDVDNYYTWQYKIEQQKVVARKSKTDLHYYSLVETPWPTANRDMIFHLQMSQDSITKVLTVLLTQVADFMPEVDGVVRIPMAHSVLTVSPLDKTNVHVRYVLDIDPGGYVPAWVANMFSALAPWHSYNNFRNSIIYQGEERITVPFITDFEL